jgi:hypothetical protein
MIELFVNLQRIGNIILMLIFKIISNLKSLFKLIMYVGQACLASYSECWLRFNGDIPDWEMNIFLRTLPFLVLVHHCRLIHGSGPNTSETPPLAFAVHLQYAGNRHHLLAIGYEKTAADRP